MKGQIAVSAEDAPIMAEVCAKLRKELQHTATFQTKIADILAQSAKLTSVSIFKTEGSSLANIQKTADDYRKLASVKTHFSDHLAAESFLTDKYTYLFLIFLLFIAASSLLVKEREEGIANLLATTPGGRRKTLAAKYLTLTVFAFILVIIFYAANFLFLTYRYGSCNLTDAIQSSAAFADFT